jgi:NADH-quinone oxidoreductase subunit M
MPTLLILLIVLPLAAAVAVALLGSGRAELIRRLSLATTVVVLALALAVAVVFARGPVSEGRGHAENRDFHPQMTVRADLMRLGTNADGSVAAIQFYLGLDGLNVWLVVLTALLLVPSVLISWTAIEDRIAEYYAWLLALEAGMIGVFLAFDVVLFYVFFELTLVPLFFLIGIWGGPEKRYAARKFFVYTFAGSLITLVGVLGIVLVLDVDPLAPEAGAPPPELTFSIPRLVTLVRQQNDRLNDPARQERLETALRAAEKKIADGPNEEDREAGRRERDEAKAALENLPLWRKIQFWCFAAMMVGFAVKVPLFPVHTWLPLAHVEAPTAGSVLLAGVLLKLGTYGFLRLCLPLTPDACVTFGAPLLGALAVVGVIYGAFCALGQDDFKKLVAYSSVSHLGLCMLGLFALNEAGLTGGLLQMINHGLSTGALFLLVGMLYERYHTRKMDDYGGMSARLRLLGFFMVFITMTSIGLPGLNGFVGEVLVLMGMYGSRNPFVSGPVLAILATSGMLLGAWYMLTLVNRVFYGPVHEPHYHGPEPKAPDLKAREWAALLPIAACCLFLGLYPQPVLDVSKPELKAVSRLVEDARRREAGATTPTQQAKAPTAPVE